MDKNKVILNLYKTLELTDLCYELKMAYYQKKYPKKILDDIKKLIIKEYISRREKQWNSQKV